MPDGAACRDTPPSLLAPGLGRAARGGGCRSARVHTRVHLCAYVCGASCAHVWHVYGGRAHSWAPGSECVFGGPGDSPAGPGQHSGPLSDPQTPSLRLPCALCSPRAPALPEVPHTDLVSHPDSHRGLQDSAFLVKILPGIFREGASERDRRHLNVLFFFIFAKRRNAEL